MSENDLTPKVVPERSLRVEPHFDCDWRPDKDGGGVFIISDYSGGHEYVRIPVENAEDLTGFIRDVLQQRKPWYSF